jgi:uncharacterized peroxidase-related enzyme
MARISYRSREQLPDDARAAFDRAIGYGPFGHQVGAFAHRPPIMRNLYRMLIELREEHVLARRYVELAVLTVSRLNRCTYCVAHHTPMLRVEGLGREATETLLEAADHPDLNDIDRLVIEYARLVTETPGRIRDAIFERLRRHFSEAQIVELTWRIALCGAFNRFNDALQLEIEPEAQAALLAES